MRHLLATVLPVHLFFNDAATTKIYTLSLHDALPIFLLHGVAAEGGGDEVRVELDDALHDAEVGLVDLPLLELDRKSTRLNSSHVESSYAVFCLKKKKRNGPSWRMVVALGPQVHAFGV